MGNLKAARKFANKRRQVIKATDERMWVFISKNPLQRLLANLFKLIDLFSAKKRTEWYVRRRRMNRLSKRLKRESLLFKYFNIRSTTSWSRRNVITFLSAGPKPRLRCSSSSIPSWVLPSTFSSIPISSISLSRTKSMWWLASWIVCTLRVSYRFILVYSILTFQPFRTSLTASLESWRRWDRSKSFFSLFHIRLCSQESDKKKMLHL